MSATLSDVNNTLTSIKQLNALFGSTPEFREKVSDVVKRLQAAMVSEQGLMTCEQGKELSPETPLGEEAQKIYVELQELVKP